MSDFQRSPAVPVVWSSQCLPCSLRVSLNPLKVFASSRNDTVAERPAAWPFHPHFILLYGYWQFLPSLDYDLVDVVYSHQSLFFEFFFEMMLLKFKNTFQYQPLHKAQSSQEAKEANEGFLNGGLNNPNFTQRGWLLPVIVIILILLGFLTGCCITYVTLLRMERIYFSPRTYEKGYKTEFCMFILSPASKSRKDELLNFPSIGKTFNRCHWSELYKRGWLWPRRKRLPHLRSRWPQIRWNPNSWNG